MFNDNQIPIELVGQGIFSTVLPNDTFEIRNLGKYPVYLDTPLIDSNISLFANTIVTIIIQRLK